MSLKIAALISAVAILTGAAACSPSLETVNCGRFDAGAMNAGTGFATRVDEDEYPPLASPDGWIEVSFTAIPALNGPVSLVQVQDDMEVNRWDLSSDHDGPVHRCRISPLKSIATCGAHPILLPYDPAGYFYLQTNGNPILEAGLSFQLCR